MVDPQTLAALKGISDREWGIIFKKLVLYADQTLKKVGFTTRSERDSINGEDIAMQSIEKLFNGDRKWDCIRYPDVQVHLYWIAKSLISSQLKSSNRSAVRTQTISDQMETEEDLSFVTEMASDDNPEEALITQENWKCIESEFGVDELGFLILCEWIDELPPRTIAENYNIDIKEVNNALKRGRRIIKKVFANN